MTVVSEILEQALREREGTKKTIERLLFDHIEKKAIETKEVNTYQGMLDRLEIEIAELRKEVDA